MTARSRLAGLISATVVVSVITLVIYPLQDLDPGVSSGVLYVLGVLLVAMYWGLWLGALTSIASAAALNYFHASPTGEFLAGKDAGDLVAICTLLVTSLVASVIADRARSRVERIRLQEVQASRARVMAAADEERRRVARDLHDGAQQRLVHTVVTLKLARQAMNGDRYEAVDALVGEALDNTEAATTELRELVRGILPSVLTREGLQSGVEVLASRAPVPISVDIPVGRLPAAIEATAYFVVAEAVTNIVKHARAARAEVTAAVEDDLLRVAVRDNGVGGARSNGSGLLGLEDRLSTLDGQLRVLSPLGGGTLVSAEIPLPR